jgi:23S rRNA (guanosine2251-2'-O)-methyltransferase
LLLAGRRRTYEVLLADDLDHADILDDIVDLAGELRVPVRRVSRRQLDDTSHTDAAQGVVARAGELPDAHLDDLCHPPARADGAPTVPFLLAVDGVTDPGNLGAMLRTAEGAGVTGVLLPRHRSVHVTPTVTKAAAGAVEHVPIALVGGLPTAISELREAGIWVVGLDADAETSLFDLPIATEPVCLVVGAEGAGLSRLVRQRCDVVASIPLRGHLGSLNVSVSAAIACYEIVRRRG